MLKKLAGNALTTLIVIYVLSVMLMVPYYNWQFAKENGFVAWFFLGEIIPTAKAMVWPFFVFL